MSISSGLAFDAISSIDFAKGFAFSSFRWNLFSLCKSVRSRPFSLPGCAGIQWTLGVERRNNQHTAIGLYCKEATAIVPAIFRIALFDCERCMLMNRACYFTFTDSSGCGFAIENWLDIERRLRLQKEPLSAYLMVDLPKDRCTPRRYLGGAMNLSYESLLKSWRSVFEAIEAGDVSPFSDVAILVARESGSIEKIHCHRLVLCSRSLVFSRMLEKSDFLESTRGIVDVTKDETLDRATLIAVLRFLYCGDVSEEYEEFKADLDALLRLLNAAEKYGIVDLKFWCESCMIIGYDTDEQRRRQLLVAETFNLTRLKTICLSQLSSDPSTWDEFVYAALGIGDSAVRDLKSITKRKSNVAKTPL